MLRKPLAVLLSFTLLLTIFFSGCGQENNQTAAQTAAKASPLLWKVEGENGNTLYLFGTIHCGDDRSSTVLDNLGEKLDECGKLAVEFDVLDYNEKASKDPLSVADDVAQFMYTDGTTIKDHLPEKLYKNCVKILKNSGTYNALLDYYNSAYWTQLISQSLMLKTSLSTDYAMDSLLLKRAKDKGLKIVELESANRQLTILNSFSEELCEMQLQEAVDGKELYDYELKSLYDTWLDGEEFTLSELLTEETEELKDEQKQLYTEYQQKFIINRNITMADKAEKLLKGKDNVFLAVGSAHLLNTFGLVQILKDRGYTVEQVSI